jgi:tRNA nucleotidyltransferase (CCA-adding enzyme)
VIDIIKTIERMPQWELLQQAAQIAAESGWHLYLVGGVVRDLLLAQTRTESLSITDIDLVVDGCDQIAEVGAGVKLAKALQQIHPAAHLDIHGTFQTAALVWPQDSEFGSLGIDIATARTEFYPYPAANPEVSASSIDRDLFRRDFTINALAWRLTPSPDPPLVDLFGGLIDLEAQQLRVLHPNSFVDDPTRIFRGARFAVRLGFKFGATTETYIRSAIRSGIYVQTAQAHSRVPALQIRLKTELKYLLQVSYWQPTIELLDNLDALKCIHPTLKLDRELLQQLRLLARCLTRFDLQQTIEHWQLRLAAMIAYLDPSYRSAVAKNLQSSPDIINRLSNLDRVQTDITSSLSDFHPVSQVVKLLRQYDLETLVLVAVRCRRILPLRRQIWRYLTVWSRIQPTLNGADLQQIGYKPGPQYRQILDALLMATLDGFVIDRSTAEEFIRSKFPS